MHWKAPRRPGRSEGGPGGFPTDWHQDAVHCPASADPEPVAAVAPGEADAHGSIHDVYAS